MASLLCIVIKKDDIKFSQVEFYRNFLLKVFCHSLGPLFLFREVECIKQGFSIEKNGFGKIMVSATMS